VSNVISGLTGSGGAKAAQTAAQMQEAQAQSNQGRQLALLSQQQAKEDLAAADMNAPGIGRAMMGFNRRAAATLGG